MVQFFEEVIELKFFSKSKGIFCIAAFIAILILFVSLRMCSQAKSASISTNNVKSILCLGDSITYGLNLSTPYTSRLSNLISTNARKTVVVKNGGIPGYTTAQILAKEKDFFLSNKTYDVVTIMAGTNDCRADSGMTIDDAISNLSKMIDLTKKYRATPMICTVPPFRKDLWKTNSEYSSTSYFNMLKLNARIKQLCKNDNIYCIDIYQAFNNNMALLQSDGLHPTSDGAQIIAQTIYNDLDN